MDQLSPREAAELLQSAPDDTVLLDVREVAELQMAALDAAVHIPMSERPNPDKNLCAGIPEV